MAPPAPHLVDEILEEIFLRLPTPAALARVSTASPSFRRIIKERSFLRRFRKLYPPPLLGFATNRGVFEPVQDPHPSAPLARALAGAADFTYSFVPWPGNDSLSPWFVRDIRDGRVLLESEYSFDSHGVFTNLAVCDPVSRRYVLLPPIPEDMTVRTEPLVEYGRFLASVGEDEDEDETLFKVICTAHYKSKLVVFVFTSSSGQWCKVATPSWSFLAPIGLRRNPLGHPYYMRGCFYWMPISTDKLLVLDTCRMESSTVNILPGYRQQLMNQPGRAIHTPSIVIGTEGALEMITLVGDLGPSGLFYLYHTYQENKGESCNQCQLKKVIALPSGWIYNIVGATEGLMFIRGMEAGSRDPDINLYCLDVKTAEVKKVCGATFYGRYCSYFGFPPSLSKPSL